MKNKYLVLIIFSFLGIVAVNAQFTVILNFAGTSNGRAPLGSLITDGTFLYGMTQGGGANGYGTVFKIKRDGTGYVKLQDMANDTLHGYYASGSLTSDGTYLYGMTLYGGLYGDGVIFKVKTDGTAYTKLLDFTGTKGRQPNGSLYYDGKYLYGMTDYGGTNGCGVIFRIKTDGSHDSTLLNFCCTWGEYPQGSLISDGTFLYGMAYQGGASGLGTIFKIRPDGSGYTVLQNLTGATGYYPYGDLTYDGKFLYGTTQQGGASGYGTIFRIKTDGSRDSVLLSFSGTANGQEPGSLVYDGTNFLFGMTEKGGNSGDGVIFKIRPNGTGFVKLVDFTGAAIGGSPAGNLLIDSTFLFGMTQGGGSNYDGIIFGMPRCTPSKVTQSPAICGGESIKVGNHIYSSTGTYYDTIPATTGCDSLITTNLTVNTIDTSVSVILKTLTSNENSAAYQWVNCNTAYSIISGATNQSYGPLVSGSYAVIVSKNGCTDTSNCRNISIPTGIFQPVNLNAQIVVYPNPSKGKFTIQSSMVSHQSLVEIYNMLGEKVYSQFSTFNSQFSIDISSQPSGIYLYRIISESGTLIGTGKLVIQ